MGGGVVGVTAAYFLAVDGHEVTVIEQEDSLAGWASGGNAGLIAPGHSFAWASPAAPKQLLRSLRGAETAIRVNPTAIMDPDLITWGLRFLRECTSDRAVRNTLIKLRLAQYSQGVLADLVADLPLPQYQPGQEGVFYLYRDAAELEAGAKKMQLLQDNGQVQEVLDSEGCVEREPAFEAVKHRIAGAVYGVTDSSGDSQVFTEDLAEQARKLGVEFRLGTKVVGIQTDGDRVVGVQTNSEILRADQYMLSLGVHSPMLSRSIGQRLPMYPAKGYSATFPIREEHRPPAHGGVDEATLVAWSNFGDRFRVSSTAEFTGYGRSWQARDFNNILRTTQELFPDAADYEDGRYRSCLRPMTPDGPPILGYGKHRNLFYNTGHGHMGWTMAPGTGKLAADLISGRPTALPMDGMEVRS